MRKRRGVGGQAEAVRRRIVLAQRGSGLSVAAFCRREGISPATFYLWRKRVEGESQAKATARACLPFAEVSVKPKTNTEESFRVEIILSSGDRLSLPAICDPFWLERVVLILRSGTC